MQLTAARSEPGFARLSAGVYPDACSDRTDQERGERTRDRSDGPTDPSSDHCSGERENFGHVRHCCREQWDRPSGERLDIGFLER